MSDIDERLSRLEPFQLALFVRRVAASSARSKGRTPTPVARPAVDEDRSHLFPLSFAQERLWFIDLLEPGQPAYNMTTAVRLPGTFSDSALERALGEALRRHEALRTRFVMVEGEPRQLVDPPKPALLRRVDLRDLAPEERGRRIRALAEAEARHLFDMRQGPLLRAALVHLDDEERLLFLTVHHIVCDGWSLRIVANELKALCGAYSQGRIEFALPDPPLQYSDFVRWQRGQLQGERAASLLDYWKRTLAGAPELLELPSDKPPPPTPSMSGGIHLFRLSERLSRAVKRLGREHGATPFMVLLAVFQVLLMRHSGQEDILVGTAVANRERAELEGLVGLLLNMVVVRSDLTGNPTFAELLERVREATLGAQAHQDLPFEKLVEELRPRRLPGRNPLFQITFSLNSEDNDAQAPFGHSGASGPELPGDLLEAGNSTAKFDLALFLTDSRQGLQGVFEYRTDLFDAATIRRLAEGFEILLQGVVSDSGRRIRELPLLGPEQRRQLLHDWNRTATDYPSQHCFHQLFEEQARRRPTAVALEFHGERISYAELDRRATRVAHLLRKLGVVPEDRVGVHLNRSTEMVAAILGIWKSGGVYLPLDPGYPHERLAFMLDDSTAKLVLTHSSSRERLLPTKAQVFCLDTALETPDRESPRSPSEDVDPRRLAYVIYTSGSTGVPKAVMVEHQGLCNLARAQQELPGVGSGARIFQFCSPSFDASIFDIVLALSHGATLSLADPESVRGGASLVQALRDQAITTLTVPPSVLAGLPPDPLPSLRTVISAGEACSWDLVARWGPGRHFVNAYGPTETTVWATFAECSEDEARPPIGKPIANTRIYVLDPNLEPAPIGTRGEIYIGGDGVARGYQGRPGLTAACFLPDPFAERPGARLYRTGDLARFRNDGALEFLGRADSQVKVRGHRIELGEIEAALALHPAVARAVVQALGQGPGGPSLTAYWIGPSEDTPSSAELRAHLRRRLPEYMLPAVFVRLESLPLTPSGKVDRARLPVPAAPGSDRKYVAPRSSTEQRLARIWAGVLGTPRVGVQDDFFELGGHSLLATQIIARVQEAYHAPVSLRRLFEAPTVEALAALVEGSERTTGPVGAPVEARPDKGAPVRVEDLSDGEVDTLLRRLIEEEGGAPR